MRGFQVDCLPFLVFYFFWQVKYFMTYISGRHYINWEKAFLQSIIVKFHYASYYLKIRYSFFLQLSCQAFLLFHFKKVMAITDNFDLEWIWDINDSSLRSVNAVEYVSSYHLLSMSWGNFLSGKLVHFSEEND